MAGFGRDHTIDRMKVQFLLGGAYYSRYCVEPTHAEAAAEACVCVCVRASSAAPIISDDTRPRVVVCTADSATIRSSAVNVALGTVVRLQIHFSEPVEDFIRDDLVVSARVRVRSFAKLRADLYVADVVVLASDAESATDNPHAGSDAAFVEVLEGAARSTSRGSGGALSTHSNRFLLRCASSPPPLSTAS